MKFPFKTAMVVISMIALFVGIRMVFPADLEYRDEIAAVAVAGSFVSIMILGMKGRLGWYGVELSQYVFRRTKSKKYYFIVLITLSVNLGMLTGINGYETVYSDSVQIVFDRIEESTGHNRTDVGKGLNPYGVMMNDPESVSIQRDLEEYGDSHGRSEIELLTNLIENPQLAYSVFVFSVGVINEATDGWVKHFITVSTIEIVAVFSFVVFLRKSKVQT